MQGGPSSLASAVGWRGEANTGKPQGKLWLHADLRKPCALLHDMPLL